MIKYRLKCNDCNQTYDSWFSSSIEFDRLKKKKFLNCYLCDSLNVDKTLMAPSIQTKNNTVQSNKIKKIKEVKNKLKEYQNFIKNNFEFVGENFAYKARSIHYNKNKRSKGIYGSATDKEIKELREEGINTEVFPWINDEDN
tara:strand:- start:6866 stop:7291 length:426 start_codon:yes stop_codon:yes gene_type:complete